MLIVVYIVVGLLLVFEIIDNIAFVKMLYSLREIREESHE